MRCAILQLCSGPDVRKNLHNVVDGMRMAQQQGAHVVALPENVMAMHPDGPQAVVEQAQWFLQQLQIAAAQTELWLIAGTLPWPTRPDGVSVPGGRVRAACFVVDAAGKIVGRYDKIHMFDVALNDFTGIYRESERIEPGTEVCVITTPWGILGLSVCYDLRFPELYIRLVQEGAEWITIPSAFTRLTGAAHWNTLVRARAIETQSIVIAANQAGSPYAGRETWGHSLAVSPWGEIWLDLGDGESSSGYQLATVELDFGQVQICRQKMPIAAQRRLL